MTIKRKNAPVIQACEVTGARGGSFVRLSEAKRDGWCNLEVGHSCVITVSQEIPVTWLAAILTRAKDVEFISAMGDPEEFPADYALMCDPEAER